MLEEKLQLSIVIPTLNEAKNIRQLIPYLQKQSNAGRIEIIVVDAAASQDGTDIIATQLHAKVVKCAACSRAKQLNLGAKAAKADLLYFVHADVLPPPNYFTLVMDAFNKGNQWGFFSFQFDSQKWYLKINSFFTRFDGLFAGGGDQTLFIQKSLFEQMNGYNPDCKIMEDFELVKRLKRTKRNYCIIKRDVIVSARKYNQNSYIRVNMVNLYMFILFWLNVPQDKMIQTYRRLLS